MPVRPLFVIGLLALGATASGVHADEGPKSLICEFKAGTAGSYEEGVFKPTTPQPLSFSIERIDLEAQTAAIKAAGSTVDGKLSIVRAINANHFLEPVTEGFLNITTVYDKSSATGLYPAVHSRHLGILGQPIYAQYTGTCREP